MRQEIQKEFVRNRQQIHTPRIIREKSNHRRKGTVNAYVRPICSVVGDLIIAPLCEQVQISVGGGGGSWPVAHITNRMTK